MELVPAKVQKVSVVDDTVVLEIFAGAKRYLVFQPGRVSVVDDKPAILTDRATPPAVQGLLRKELQPSILTRVDDHRYVFGRKDADDVVVVVEADGRDPRWLLLGKAKDVDGERILAAGPATRAKDGRDLRRGRLYAPPPNAPSPMPSTMQASPTTTKPTQDPATAALASRLKTELQRKKRLVKALEGDLKKHGDPAILEENGELLKTVMGKWPKGASVVDVVGYDGAARSVAVDPSKDAKQNLQALFTKAKKAKTAIALTQPRLDDARAGLAALEDARAGLDDVAQHPRIAALLSTSGPSARRKAAMATASSSGGRKSWRCFAVAQGVVVKVGRGAKDNDVLVKASNGNDLWLHARDATGAHVVVPSSGGVVADDVVRDAALLAAWFSTQRGERSVMVQHTRVKNLKKPGAGSPAGLWLVGHEAVFALRVDDDRVRMLLSSEVAA